MGSARQGCTTAVRGPGPRSAYPLGRHMHLGQGGLVGSRLGNRLGSTWCIQYSGTWERIYAGALIRTWTAGPQIARIFAPRKSALIFASHFSGSSRALARAIADDFADYPAIFPAFPLPCSTTLPTTLPTPRSSAARAFRRLQNSHSTSPSSLGKEISASTETWNVGAPSTVTVTLPPAATILCAISPALNCRHCRWLITSSLTSTTPPPGLHPVVYTWAVYTWVVYTPATYCSTLGLSIPLVYTLSPDGLHPSRQGGLHPSVRVVYTPQAVYSRVVYTCRGGLHLPGLHPTRAPPPVQLAHPAGRRLVQNVRMRPVSRSSSRFAHGR